jgi:3-deoxy-D-manno-octulosonic-acid transferase
MMPAYHLLTALLSPFVFLLFTLHSLVTGKKRRGLGHHFGRFPKLGDDPGAPRKKTLWLYALSRGEVVAAGPVLKKIRQLRPHLRLVVSVTTESGYDAARQLADCADLVVFHPLDCLPFYHRAIAALRPDIFVLTETGFWPGLPDWLHRRGVPVILFHGRISQKSLERYLALRFLTQPLLSLFSDLCMQNEQGRDDFLALGAAAEKTVVVGDTKYDALPAIPDDERKRFRRALGLADDRPVFTAGSTHAGEEDIVLDAFTQIQRSVPGLLLALAPRRVERRQEVEALIARRGLRCVRRTAHASGDLADVDVLLVDTMGELPKFYAIAQTTFVGRSLIPPGGGHSLIEPAALGKRVCHGPCLEYKQADADFLAQRGLAVCVRSAAELADASLCAIQDPGLRSALELTARSAFAEKAGAAERLANIILSRLDTARA